MRRSNFVALRYLSTRRAMGFVVVGLVGVLASSARAQTVSRSLLRPTDVMDWLPPTTETLIVVNEPFDPTARPQTRHDVVAALGLIASGPLVERDKDAVAMLRGVRARFAVEGARSFRAPQGFGLAPYDGCHILVFDERDSGTVRQFVDRLRSSGGTSVAVVGLDALKFNWREEHDDWVGFVFRPMPNVLVTTTSEAMAIELVRRVQGRHDDVAFPKTLIEWTAVDTTAPIFALRHFRSDASMKDPTSPLIPQGPGERALDPQAIGLAVSVLVEPTSRLVFNYYSGYSDAAVRAAGMMWENVSGLKLSPRSKGNVQVVVAPSDDEEWALAIFKLLGMLGHAIYV